MNSSKFRFTLDLHSTHSQYSIPVMVGDTSVTLLISITDGAVPYLMGEGCIAKLSIKRPDGSIIKETCMIRNGSVIEYPFEQNENTCAMEGVHYCDITLETPDGARVGSPRFIMVVSDMVVRSDDAPLSDDTKTWVDAMLSAEGDRQFKESLRVEAENRRVIAEAERVAAEAKRGDITKYALKAEESASRAEKAAERIEDCEERVSHNEKRLTNIEKGYSDDFFITDDTIAAIKLVPSNAYPYAEVKKIYGAFVLIDGVRAARSPKRLEVCKSAEKTVLDTTLDLSDMADTMTVEKLDDGSFKFNGYTSDLGNGGARKFATMNLPTGTYALSYTIVSNLNGVPPILYIHTSNGYERFEDSIIFTTVEADLTLLIDINVGYGNVADDLIILFEILKGTHTSGAFIGDLIVKSTFNIPEEVREMKGYGLGSNYVDFEKKILYIARELIDNASVPVEPPMIIDISQYLSDDNLIAVEPNDYIRVIQYDDTPYALKTEISYMVKGVS